MLHQAPVTSTPPGCQEYFKVSWRTGNTMRSFQSRSLGFKYWNDQKIRDQVASEFEPASRRNEDIYIEDDTDSWVRDNYYNNAIQYDSLGIPYYGRERSSNMFPQARSLQGRRGRKFDWLSLVKLKPFRVRTRAGRRVDTEYSSNSLGHLLMVSNPQCNVGQLSLPSNDTDIVTTDCWHWNHHCFYCCGLG